MPHIDKQELLNLLSKKRTFIEIVKHFKIHPSKNREISKMLFDLTKQNEIFIDSHKKYFIPNFLFTVVETIKLNAKFGYGFIDFADNKSAFVPKGNRGTAMHGDIVEAKIFEDDFKAGSYQAIVTKIQTRSVSTFVGVTEKFKDRWSVKPLNSKIMGIFKIMDWDNPQDNQLIKVKITKYGSYYFDVEVIKVLGTANNAFNKINAFIEESNVSTSFSSQLLDEADRIPEQVTEDDLKDRHDLRNDMVITIDGEDTKDFDDAIQISKINKDFILKIHIADVTHYVKEDSAIDQEALKRGTSIYLVDRVIPMLPEKLSNGICSLNPHVDRLVITTEVKINGQNGQTIDYKVYPSVINSKHRLTYDQVNQFYSDKITFNDVELTNMLNVAHELSIVLRDYKNKKGYVDFEIEESKIILDNNGAASDIKVINRGISEMMIEDFMVRNNEVIAEFISSKKLPFIYRTHDKPGDEKIKFLKQIASLFDVDVEIPHSPSPLQFSRIVNAFKAKYFGNFIKMMLLRTMEKAIYSPNNIGHFGLASTSYSHFTSPIRRYPDLIAHRMVRSYIFKNNNTNSKKHYGEILGNVANISSTREQKAVELERKVNDIKKAELFSKFINKTFKAQIISIVKFGFFVEFENRANGFVHASSCTDGKYTMSDDRMFFVNMNTKKSFNLGDNIEVVVVNTIIDEGKIDVIPLEFAKNLKNTKV